MGDGRPLKGHVRAILEGGWAGQSVRCGALQRPTGGLMLLDAADFHEGIRRSSKDLREERRGGSAPPLPAPGPGRTVGI